MEKGVSIRGLKGILPKRGKPVSIEEINRARRIRAAQHYQRFIDQDNEDSDETERPSESSKIE